MKKISLLALLITINLMFSQANWDYATSQIYTPQPGFSPKKVLLDRAPMFADLYNFNYSEHNTSSSAHFKQAISELYAASSQQYFTNPSSLPNFEDVAEHATEVPIGIISTPVSYLNYDEEDNSNGNLTFANGIFSPINSAIPSFIEKDLLVIAPLFPAFSSSNNSFSFVVNGRQMYQYVATVQHLEADFGDGVWRSLINNYFVNPPVTVTLATNGIQKQQINFRATMDNGIVKNTSATILLSQKIPDVGVLKAGGCGISPLQKYRSTISDALGVKGGIEYKVFYGEQNTTCSPIKPVIIVDGFDPGDVRRISFQDCLIDERCIDKNPYATIDNYLSIEKLMEYGNNQSLIEDLNNQNYDVILVNFPYYRRDPNNSNSELISAGADDIFRNGKTVASFIQQINADLQALGSTEKLIVVGPSMGGLITRYALAYLEKEGINHNTKLWVSMDSPHKGANIPLAVQKDIWFFAKKLKQVNADKQFTETLHSKAAEQMLIDIVMENGVVVKNQANVNFLNELNSNGISGSSGFPVSYGIQKIAIANGSLYGVKNVIPKQNFLHIAASAKIKLFGIKVGRKRIFKVNNFYMPDFGGSTMLVDLQGRNPDENIGNTTHISTINAWWNTNGSMDAVPGGSTNSANDVKEQVNGSLEDQNAFTFPLGIGNFFIFPILNTAKNLIIDRYIPATKEAIITPQSFIPTHSALNTNGFSDWYQPVANLVCSGQTPFDSFYGERFNTPHVTFSNQMATWLLNNLNSGLQPPSFPVDPEQLEGPTPLCLNTINTYFFSNACKVPGIPVWSVSDNLQILSITDYSVTVQAIASGNASITATFATGSVTKNIVMPRPKLLSFALENPAPPYYCITPPELLEMSIESNYVRANFTGMTLAEINNSQNWEWQPDNNLIMLSGSGNKRIICPVGTGYTSFKVRARNGCSWSEWYQYPTFQIKAKPIVYFTVAPNPATETLNVSLENNNIQLPTSASSSMNVSSGISAKLYDSLGNQKASFNLINNAATIDINHLPAGIYYLKIFVGNNWESHTVIKQ